MSRLIALLALLAAFCGGAAAAPACEQPGGMGGTGIRADGGIGGTGMRAQGELGLIGVITGFASICVNGAEVHYDAATPVSLNGQPVPAQALAIGQVVAVRAVGDENNARAESIQIVEAAVGPVTAIDSAAGLLQVSGQTVRLQPSTVLGPGLTSDTLKSVPLGESLRVSGLRTADGSIAATRLERAAPGEKVFAGALLSEQLGSGRFIVTGYVSELDPAGGVRVSGIEFAAAPEMVARLESDRLVRLAGRLDAGGRRVVERTEFLASPLSARPEPGLRPPTIRRERSGPERSGADRSSAERSERLERSGRSERDERPERAERSGPGRAERVERPERRERPERAERSGRGGGAERPERIDRSGRH